MCKPYIIKTTRIMPKQQQGFTLFMVLVVMMVIAFMVVGSTQAYNTELRVSTNDADRKYAFQLAEQTLRKGEDEVIAIMKDSSQNLPTPQDTCEGGWCTAAVDSNVVAWERKCDNELCIEKNGKQFGDGRYIIERVDEDKNIFRVTARAVGQNKNTVVTLQSYLQASTNE